MLDSLSSLGGVAAYVMVAAMAALEAGAFVGLFVPGELALLTGGYIAYQGNASLGIMMGVAAAGAVFGDSLGYEIGRHLGPALQRSRLGRRVGDERWDRAEAFLERRGGRAILAGRFVGVLRALVPAVAGATRMPYRRFLAWNVLGALVWAPGTVLLGYAAGPSYRRVEGYAGPAGLVLVGVFTAVAAVVLTGRWMAGHQDRVRAAVNGVLRQRRVAPLIRRYRSQLDFLRDRFRPGNALGLALTAQLTLLIAAGWAFGALLQDVVGRDDSTRIDLPIVRYLAGHRTAWLTTAMRESTRLGGSGVLVPLVGIVGAAAYQRTRRWTAVAQLGVALGGAIAIGNVIKHLVGRPRPHVGAVVANANGYAFPSGHTTQITAVAVSLAVLASGAVTSWTRRVAVWSVALLVCLTVGFSRVYLGVHWPTDVLAGFALGGLWAVVTALAFHRPRHL